MLRVLRILAVAAAIVLGLDGITSSASASSGTLVITSDTTLTEDHSGNILIVGDNLTLDGAGHSVFGPGVEGFSGGIEIAGGTDVTVKRCRVSGFNVNGIFAGGASNSRYEANNLDGNANHGIHLDFGVGNVVVENTSGSNGGIGIVLTHMQESWIEANTLQGNGWAGVALFDGSHSNTVKGNVISGNVGQGIQLEGSEVWGNEIRGNYIGTDASGTLPLGNGSNGILIRLGAFDNYVTDNVISANSANGVALENDGTTGNTFQGNFIGTDVTGAALLGNAGSGVLIDGEAADNQVGGTTTGARNVISGNGFVGIAIRTNGGNVIEGNFIGTDVTGTARLGNAIVGIDILNSSNNQIGGSEDGARNVISGNGLWNVAINASASTGNRVQGNYIGTDVTGSYAIGGAEVDGIAIEDSPGNTIGGAEAALRNVISGNVGQGIRIYGSSTSGNEIRGNYIGTDASGTLPLGNGQLHFHSGIVIHIGASDNSVIDNVISANGAEGVSLFDEGTTGNTIQGNFIGTDVTGTTPLGNAFNGVAIYGGAAGNHVGGSAAGARNLISGNSGSGVAIISLGSTENRLQGNFIGTDITGTAALGNGSDGIVIADQATGNHIGGTDPGARNLISGNSESGVAIIDPGTTGNLVQGNFIGTDITGAAALGNLRGVLVIGSPAENAIGGTGAGAGNTISGNENEGVVFYGAGTTANILQGNFIGTDSGGTSPLPNGLGVGIGGEASESLIGGTEPGAGNVISGNTSNGVYIVDPGTTANRVQGNFIGTDMTGILALGNGGTGVVITNGAAGNPILSNAIRSNGGLGIDLGDDGVTPNDRLDRDSGPNDLQNFPVLSPPVLFHGALKVGGILTSRPNSTYRIELFDVAACDGSGYGEGDKFLGFLQVTTGHFGDAVFVFQLPPNFPLNHFVTATATNSAGSTSEFSRCAGPAVRVGGGH